MLKAGFAADPAGVVRQVPGLGDDNFAVCPADDCGATVLWVRRANIVLLIGVRTPGGAEQAPTLARLALGRF
jgi:hypothetical protein